MAGDSDVMREAKARCGTPGQDQSLERDTNATGHSSAESRHSFNRGSRYLLGDLRDVAALAQEVSTSTQGRSSK